jgi:glycyl-tRNA synthetase beta chain
MKPSPDRRVLPLLLEVGCEEIPARFLAEAEKNLGERLQVALAEARLLHNQPPVAQSGTDAVEPRTPDSRTGRFVQTYSTPRRLVVFVREVLARQPDQVEEVLGPPVKVALDALGKPTRAAESFAQKNGARVEDLVRVTTAKGEYLALRKTVQGRPAEGLLPEILPPAILGLSFPKSMYWVAKSGPRFVRPIRWILALLGEGKQARVIPFEIAGVKAGNFTYGHRALGQRTIRVTSFKDYTKRLLESDVEISPERRREAVLQKSKVLLEPLGLSLIQDEGLLDWQVNSCEWPRPVLGNFDTRFLSLPREILVTVMRDHQKYFAVEDRQGALQPHFVGVLNMPADTRGLIRQGHERVLTAQFTDARFFWQADQRLSLVDRGGLLSNVTYQAELGSYAEKVRRMTTVATHICEELEGRGGWTPADTRHAVQAVELAKCDLTAQMVQEFPELQGVVGGLYAQAQGLPGEVADAIYDHYLPQGAEDRCPRSLIGAVVSVADKLDSVVGGFAVGHEPSGSSDPFALRRQANAIIRVLLEFRMPVGMKQAVEQALNALDIPWRKPRFEVFDQLLEFFGERLRYYFESVRLFRYDTARAILAAGWDVPVEALGRAEALEAMRGGENLEALAAAAKRIKNILTKSATSADWEPGEVETAVLTESAEKHLYAAYQKVAEQAGALGKAGDYRGALESIASLRPAVDRLFDKVLVMAAEPVVRKNRLRLLGKLDDLFSSIAQFAEIAGEAANVDASTSKAGKRQK